MDGMRAAFARTTSQLLDEDPRVALVLAEISVSGYFSSAIERHPDRAVNLGIAEQAMIGVAAGFAMEGFHPIAHSIGAFIAERPYEQLKLDIGYQGLGGTFVGIGASYDYSAEGATHHAPGDAQVMSAIPRMRVLVPGHPREVTTLLRTTYAGPDPTYLRLAAATNPEPLDVRPGRLELVARGGGPTVVAFGPMLGPTLLACAGLDVTICYATSLRPFDAAGLAAVVGDDPVVIAVEPWYEGTAAAEITAALSHAPARYGWIGVPRAFVHDYGTRDDLDRDAGLDPAAIRRRIVAMAGRAG
jgi:transketolase